MSSLVFAGAFNPPTIAHIELAHHALEQLHFDHVIFVPSKSKYINEDQAKDFSFTDEERLEMLRAIAENRPWMKVSDYEILAEKQPRTFQTLCHLRGETGEELKLLLGSDKLPEFEHGWLHIEDIGEQFGFAVFARDTDEVQQMIQEDAYLSSISNYISILDTPMTYRHVSSSLVRKLLKSGHLSEVWSYLTPELKDGHWFDRFRENKSMKTLLWDYNGTILDDTWVCLDVEIQMLKERNMKHDYTIEDYRDLFCFPVQDYYKKLGYDFEIESFEDLSVQYIELYDKLFPECQLTEGFIEKIEEAKEKGYRNVILSACEQNILNEQVEALGIQDYFDSINGISDIYASSKIEMGLAWMKNEGVDPKDCLFIGDTLHDAETAKALGVDCVLVANGHQSFEVLQEAGVPVVHTLKEIIL